MRIDVAERDYTTAVGSLIDGNLLAARTATGLAERLQDYAGMAGDDDTAAAFSASYDEAAAASVAALQSVVGAFATLGRLVEASLANHAHAESRAVLPGWGRAVTAPPTVADTAVGLLLAEPPSSLGAGSSGPGGVLGMVLDVLHDVFWPTADTTCLRAAAHAWSTAAVSVDLLTARCDAAVADLEGSRSPEVPLAVGVITDLRDRIGDLADQLDSLGRACGDYADHVDAKRHELLGLLKDLAYELGLGALAAGAIDFVTAGGATGPAAALGAARIASASNRFRSILESLRLLVAGPTLQTRAVAVTAGDVGVFSERINGARVMLIEGRTAGATRESPGVLGRFRPGWLSRHEGGGIGHAKVKHVGLSDQDLATRLAKEPGRRMVSTFPDQSTAERAIERVLQASEHKIEHWLSTATTAQPAFQLDIGEPVGRVLLRGASETVDGSTVRVVLRKDAAMPDGWRIKTAFIFP